MTDADELDELERRREQLRSRLVEAAKQNQATRMAVMLGTGRAGTTAVIAAIVIAFAIGAAIGAIFLPTLELYARVCR